MPKGILYVRIPNDLDVKLRKVAVDSDAPVSSVVRQLLYKALGLPCPVCGRDHVILPTNGAGDPLPQPRH
jgi:hypothetical protein